MVENVAEQPVQVSEKREGINDLLEKEIVKFSTYFHDWYIELSEEEKQKYGNDSFGKFKDRLKANLNHILPILFPELDPIDAVDSGLNIIKKFSFVDQFDWFCNQVSTDSGRDVVSIFAFIESFPTGLVHDNPQVLQGILDTDRKLVTKVYGEEPYGTRGYAEQEYIKYLMASVNLFIQNELGEIDSVDKERLEKLFAVVEKIGTYAGNDGEEIQNLMTIFTRYNRYRSFMNITDEALEQLITDFLYSNNDVLRQLHEEPRRMLSESEGFGLGDALIYSYTLNWNPKDFGDMMLVLKEVPSTTLEQYQKNRRDSSALDSVFTGDFHEVVHEQDPNVKALFDAIIYFYETGDSARYYEIKPKVQRLRSYTQSLDDRILDKAAFEKTIPDPQSSSPIKAIDLVKRLRRNLDIDDDAPPKTEVEDLNQTIENVVVGHEPERIIDTPEELNVMLKAFNDVLENAYEYNSPMMDIKNALLASWLEQRAYKTLQSMNTFEAQQQMFKEAWFGEVLRFYFLTYSPEAYNKDALDKFIQDVQSLPARDYRKAYQMIGQKAIRNISELSKLYKEKGRVSIDSLWGGGLGYQLISLIDEREALTEYERKFIGEKVKAHSLGVKDDLYHPGD